VFAKSPVDRSRPDTVCSAPMAYEFTLTRRIEFAETDMAGIVHFANFYRMMENTEHAFFRSLGFSIHGDYDGVHIGWPRVSTSCDFFKPLRFEDMVDVQLLVAEVRNRSIRYGFRFWKTENGERVEVARGMVSTVCASVDKKAGVIAAVPIPEVIRARIAAAPAEMLTIFSPSPAK
jgi:YbgC/YbaW family acyl-CoA thioester hydrolase